MVETAVRKGFTTGLFNTVKQYAYHGYFVLSWLLYLYGCYGYFGNCQKSKADLKFKLLKLLELLKLKIFFFVETSTKMCDSLIKWGNSKILSPCKQIKQGGSQLNRKKKTAHTCMSQVSVCN